MSLAEPVEGELLYSVLARTRDALGPVIDCIFLRVAMGRRAEVVEMHLPSGIRRLVPFSGEHAAARLVQAHTQFNYHAHWIGPERGRQLMARMLADRPAGMTRGTELARGAAPWHRTLMFCAECAREDIASMGTPCWRACHQLPGVFLCAGHGLPLLASTASVHSQHRLLTCPSESVRGAPPLECAFLARTALSIARLSRDLRDRNAAPAGGAHMQATMRNFLADRDWLGPNGMAKPGLLAAIEARYGADRLDSFGLRLSGARGSHPMQNLWGRTPVVRGPTFWGVLMLDFLEVGADEFLDRCAAWQDEPVRDPPRPPNPRPGRMARHKSALLAALHEKPPPHRAELRRRAGRAYDYLRVNDPEWLDGVLPPKRSTARSLDWRAEDARLSKQVRAALAKVHENGSRQQPTFSAVAAELGVRSKLFREAHRLKRTAGLVRSLLSPSTADGASAEQGREPARPEPAARTSTRQAARTRKHAGHTADPEPRNDHPALPGGREPVVGRILRSAP